MYLLALVQGWAAGSLVHSGTARRGRQQGQGVQDGVFKGDHSPLEISFTGHLETHMPDHSQGPPVSLSFPRPHQGKPRVLIRDCQKPHTSDEGQRSFLSIWTTSQGTQRGIPSVSVVSNVMGHFCFPKPRSEVFPKPPQARNLIYFFWGGGHSKWYVELPQPETKAVPPAVEAQSLNHWITRKSNVVHFVLLEYLLIHLAAQGLSCGTWDLWLWHSNS